MKNIICMLLFVLMMGTSIAENRPEEIPSKLTELKSLSWYQQTGERWMDFLARNPEDKNGWLEYYKAASFGKATQGQLEKIQSEIETLFPESRESNYVKFRSNGWNANGVNYLKEAIRQDQGAKSFLAEEIMLAEVLLDADQRTQLSKMVYDAKVIYPSLLNYSYNVLMSTGEEGILVVEGEHSTIPLWVLQDVMGVRTDVKVLNLDLTEHREFLSAWMQENQLQGLNASGNIEKSVLLRELPLANPNKDFYYALTLSNKDLIPVEERLYVVGLASMHTENEFDNYQVLQQNVEQKFLMDYLTVNFNGEPKTSTGRVYETNYIVPFLLLKEYYDEIGDQANAEKWREQILEVAERSDLKDRVQKLMDQGRSKAEPAVFKVVEIPTKVFDKRMKQVKGNLYAADSEVSNKDYWFFLDYLYRNEYKEIYEKSVVDKSKYDPLTASFLDNYHYSPVNSEAQKSKVEKTYMKRYNDYPAMDMSHEAAKAYCEWLTFQYNNQPSRKYKKVKFRLPTRQEWTIAALGYKAFQSWELSENQVIVHSRQGKKKITNTYDLSQYQVDYPWAMARFDQRNSITNEHKCYLANIKAPDEISCPAGIKGDGFTLTSPIMTYFANNMGLYDVVGNVAEMTNLNGIAMGGSWNHPAEESTITSINRYEGSDISVGIRLFMDVIEE
ncbi:MAG: SUMF1/EgtB/PvdO family nonheme iron enzyme [Cytophagales bacterium]|nr:SUMF1/EgtB/PvdO family nonheme iron enzyme [Cytophagales bacterium]